MIRLFHVVRKEAQQLRRDRSMVGMVVLAPIIQLIVFGYAANLDVTDVRVLFVDRDRSAASLTLGETIAESRYFDIVGAHAQPAEITPALIEGSADIAVIIPEGYGESLAAGRPLTIQLVADGSDSTAATLGLGYAQGLLADAHAPARVIGPNVVVEPRVWYNPELRSRWFYVPAIIVMVLMMVTMISPSMAIVREKEIGTLEQVMVTPLRSWELIVGKLLPYFVIGMIDLILVTIFAVWFFEVRFAGSLAVLALLSVPVMATLLGLGLLVSTIVRTQQQAMLLSMFALMLPMIYLSGLIFPIENMPAPIQAITWAIPMRYYTDIVRGVFLKGSGLEMLWREGAILCGFAAAVLTTASLRFRKRLD